MYGDSRQSGDEYEVDRFVVEDGYLSSGEGENVGSEVGETEDEEADEKILGSGLRAKSTASSTSVRTVSVGSISSMSSFTSSTLFIPDNLRPCTTLPSSPLQITHPSSTASSVTHKSPTPTPCMASPSEIAEDITDATVFFSRRCNKARPSLRLWLTAEVMRDPGVVEALEVARERELGGIRVRDGGWDIWIGHASGEK
ncbi:hypothetical protein IAQ61_008014 [Plenodomus lingam]|uniref:uncharacterized protein n=1 Tax=Leptosphaeria maculans TaxID=5022 RepID=UPI00332DC579|nr:hypothetical protein IAQ61_008014 [Plenodomus lingam]